MVLAAREGEWAPKKLVCKGRNELGRYVWPNMEKSQEEERGNRRGLEEPDVPG